MVSIEIQGMPKWAVNLLLALLCVAMLPVSILILSYFLSKRIYVWIARQGGARRKVFQVIFFITCLAFGVAYGFVLVKGGLALLGRGGAEKTGGIALFQRATATPTLAPPTPTIQATPTLKPTSPSTSTPTLIPTATLTPTPLPPTPTPRAEACVGGEVMPVTAMFVYEDGSIGVVLEGQSIHERAETVRLAGVEMPQRGARLWNAIGYLRDLIFRKNLRLYAEPQLPDRLPDNSLPRYLMTEDGRLVNLLLVEDGYASLSEEAAFQQSACFPYFQQAQAEAQAQMKGIWGTSINYYAVSPTPAFP